MMNKQEKMDELRAEAEEIRARVCAPGVNLVWGEGDLDTPLMMVGEAPGAGEDRLGRPFVGVSGQLLDAELELVGLSRESIYITGAVKCRPTVVREDRTYNRAPDRQEIEAWRPLLLRQIEAIEPKVILCLGSVAANVLIHPGFRMVKERGQWFDGVTGIRTMATFHPAYIHRWRLAPERLQHQQFREDLRAVAQAAFGVR